MMAFTMDIEVARRYAGSEGALLACQAVCCADVSWASQFPHEQEALSPALSHVCSVGEPTNDVEAGRRLWEVTVQELDEAGAEAEA